MRRTVAVSLVLSALLVLAACGSSAKTASTAEQFSSPSYEPAGPNPSISARMVCEKEARTDIAASIGLKQTSVTTPTWDRAEHLYSCTYVYPHGKITLSVKELSNADETTAYFDATRKKYGDTQMLNGLGQGAWILKNNDVVVRKDYKVLLVDVQGIPANFAPMMTRSDVALNVGVAIMGCWSGA